MTHYRYHLEKYKSKANRYTCPVCHKPHQFTRYIDEQTGEYLADHVGICNRVTSCGYHYTPKDYFRDNNIFTPTAKSQYPKATGLTKPCALSSMPVSKTSPPNYIPSEIFQKTLRNYKNNNLIRYLKTTFDRNTVEALIAVYQIGTSDHFGGGSTIFWQIDTHNNIRTGKVIKYDPNTGKRIKKPFVHTNWIHTLEYKDSFNLNQCLFGEHLLNEDPAASVAIVESEKTAIIAQAKYPEYLWLATGSLNEFKLAKLEILKNRFVVAFPDLGAYDRWKQKASELDFHIHVSDYLEKHATEKHRKQGLDIADFII